MPKKVVSLVILINTIILALGAPQSQAVSTETVLNRQKALALVIDNSSAIWKASEDERFEKKDYETEAAKAKGIDTKRVFLYHNPYTDDDVYYYFDASEQMQMRLLKEFMPEQMKFAWEIKKITLKLTENIMANTANDIFMGLYSTYQNQLLTQKSLDYATKAHEREKVRFLNGLITELEFEESGLSVKKAENAVIKAKRDFDNMHRQFNSLAGLPMDYRYETIGTPWIGYQQISISEEEAIDKALSGRMEIWSIKQQIRLIELKMEINRHMNVHLTHPDRRKDYQESQDELDKLNIQLAEEEYKIKKEIKEACQDIQEGFLDLELAKQNLAKQKNQLETIRIQVQSGLIPESVVEQMEQVIKQLEFAVNINIIAVMNKNDKLERAVSVGPGY